MDAQINDGERCQNGVEEHRVSVPVPSPVIIEPREAKPNGKRDADVKRRHAVGERVNATKPVCNFRREGVGQGFHFRNGIPSRAR